MPIAVTLHTPTAPPAPAFIHNLLVLVAYSKGPPDMSTATLMWTPPNTRTDGSALPPDQISEADVFDTAATDPSQPIGNVRGAGSTFTTDTLSVGVHNFTVITRDTTGHSSAASNVASVTVQATAANPSAITDLTATLNP